jgi:hypothetical protein
MSKDDDERWRNFMYYKIYATDKDLEGALPIVLVLLCVVLIIMLLIYFV